MGSTGVSGIGLALTGASRYVVAPLAVGALAGLGLFTVTWLADIYGLVAPEGGFGRAASQPPRLVVQAGVRAVHDPLFPTSYLLSQGLFVDAGELWVAPRLDASPDGRHRRYALLAGRTVLGGRAASQPWSLGVRLGVRDFAETHEGFGVTSLEAALEGRLELAALGPTLEGAFGFAEFGYSREWHRFDGAPGYPWDALLGRMGFGFYVGHGRVRGEAWFAYDHRRDTVAGGLHLPSIPAGYAGFLEHRTELYFGQNFGGAVELAYGSAAVASAYLLVKFPKGSW